MEIKREQDWKQQEHLFGEMTKNAYDDIKGKIWKKQEEGGQEEKKEGEGEIKKE